MRTHRRRVHTQAAERVMHLAYLDPHPVPDSIPEALQILYTVDALGALGTHVTLITPMPTTPVDPSDILGRVLSKNVELRQLPPGLPRWLPIRSNQPFYRAAIRALGPLAADAVLVRNLKMAEQLLKQMPQVPLFFETHELFAQTYREEHPLRTWREQRKLDQLVAREGFVYRHAAGLIALTPLLLEDIRKEYGIETAGIVAPDGVDIEQARAPINVPRPKTPLLLYLGSLHPWKGVDTLIRAMTHLEQEAMLCLAGGDAQRIEELRALARELGVEQRVQFVGPVPPGQRFEWIHKADICLLPLTDTSIGSRYTSPLKLFEYLAAGKPVVVSDLPSMRAVLEPGRHAIMAASSDPISFANAIERLLVDPSQRQRLGEAARRHAGNFTWASRAGIIRREIDKRLRT